MSFKKQKLVFVDLETTGLNPEIHEIIEIGSLIVDQDWLRNKPEFKIIEEIELKIKPENIEKADLEALSLNGYNPLQWTFAYSLPEAMKIFSEKSKGGIMVAHNVIFDFMFLDKAFKKTNVENKMHYHKIDTISLAFAKLNNSDVDKYSLDYLCQYFGIKNENPHHALSDVRATFELFKKLING